MERYPDKFDQELIKAFLKLKTPREIQKFLRDLFTLAEIKEFSRRFQIAKALYLRQGSYQTIAQHLKVSTTTVTRVADWLFKKGLNGYQVVLKRLYRHRKM